MHRATARTQNRAPRTRGGPAQPRLGEALGFGLALGFGDALLDADALGLGEALGFGFGAGWSRLNVVEPGSPPSVPMRRRYFPGAAQPSFGEQAGPEPRPDQLLDTDVAQPGLNATGSSSSAERHTDESQTAVSPLVMTATRSVSDGSSVQPLRAVVDTSSSTRTFARAGWSAGTDGVMRTDSGVHRFAEVASATCADACATLVGVGVGVGLTEAAEDADGDALGAGAAVGSGSSDPPGHTCTAPQATRNTTASTRKRRRQ